MTCFILVSMCYVLFVASLCMCVCVCVYKLCFLEIIVIDLLHFI